MKNRDTLLFPALILLAVLTASPTPAQIQMSSGSYTQNFDSLGAANANWTNNTTLLGWYSSKGNGDSTNYLADTGTSTTGGIHSYGVAGVSSVADRALGSLASGTATPLAFGVRFTNNIASTQTNITVSYLGEQWRTGNTASSQTLAFSVGVSSSPITNTHTAATWSNFTPLNFVSPNLSAVTSAMDGNATTNRLIFANVILTGVSVLPGQELMLRWSDIDDTGSDSGLAIDDLTVSFSGGISNPPAAPTILTQPQSQTATVGGNATFSVIATGNPAPAYQWQFNNTNLLGATSSSLTLNSVTTNESGNYLVVITNSAGVTNSQTVTLIVVPLPPFMPGVSLLTYNVKGNGALDWSTNAAQVQAIARQLQYLQPDIITFNEIPFDLRHEMTNFISAFLPGYFLAVSSGTDGSICSAIASRYSITRSNKWLDGIDLRSFGYSNANNALDNFTRDLFEAQIAVPGFARPLHVFTTHLKSTAGTTYADASAKRAAEATAITNFFATNLFVLYPYDPYTLTGDMNDDDSNALAIQKLISPVTGLNLTSPKNSVTGSINTFSTTTANPGSRIDFIFPGPLLYSNIKTSRVFRTDRLTPLPPNLNSNDCKVASDHLPVLMTFNNPYDKPFKLLSFTRTNLTVTLNWQSVPGQPYRVESSTNLTTWSMLANNLVATGVNFTYATNLSDATRFFRVYRVP